MTPLTWNHACSVGVRAMDDQHGILMETMNELRLALVHGASHSHVAQLVDRLAEYTRTHFQSEEQLMEQTGYPGLEEHRHAHQVILAEILEAAHRCQCNGFAGIEGSLCSPCKWLAQHIEDLDRQYGPWLNDRGIQ